MRQIIRAFVVLLAGIVLVACSNYDNDVPNAPNAPDVPPAPSTTPATPIPSVNDPYVKGKACGARTRYSCEANEYCYFAPNTSCDYADRTGYCRPRPQMCTREYRPVCGCDGKTYPTACVAASSGTAVLSEGTCQ